MSLLDTDEKLPLSTLSVSNDKLIYELDKPLPILSKHDSIAFLYRKEIKRSRKQAKWFHVRAKIRSEEGMRNSYINCKVFSNEILKEKSFRLFTPIAQVGEENVYEFVFKIPPYKESFELSLSIVPSFIFEGELVELNVWEYYE